MVNHAREDQPGPDHPAYAEEREDDGNRDDRIYEAWISEQEDTRSVNG